MLRLSLDQSLSPTRTPRTPMRTPRTPQTTPRGTKETSTQRVVAPYTPKRIQRLDSEVHRNDDTITKHIKPDLTRMTLDIQVSLWASLRCKLSYSVSEAPDTRLMPPQSFYAFHLRIGEPMPLSTFYKAAGSPRRDEYDKTKGKGSSPRQWEHNMGRFAVSHRR